MLLVWFVVKFLVLELAQGLKNYNRKGAEGDKGEEGMEFGPSHTFFAFAAALSCTITIRADNTRLQAP
ncbi:hypothetical protein FACS1894109_00450 [Spirochaetia bacterium]|nr:hypothetical protein FACS1894109_00450 [Spirochaetia bacterium]